MKNLLLSLFGILLYILSVYFTKTDRNGIEVYPIYYSVIIGVLTLVFTVLASVNLWKSNFKLVVGLITYFWVIAVLWKKD